MVFRKSFEVPVVIKKSRIFENSVSMVSQLCHLLTFGLEPPRKQFETALLILSVDVDVGARKLGLFNEGKNDTCVHKYLSEAQVGEIEETALPLFVDTFSEFEVPATIAVRGQLAALDDGFLDLLLTSPVKHDIGAHGYSHKNFKHLKEKKPKRTKPNR
jgi:hypothetical protein